MTKPDVTALAVELADLHAASFAVPRPWSADEFRAYLDDPACLLIGDETGFALFRQVADEAELLTIVVPPALRGRGRAKALLQSGLDGLAGRGTQMCFLEVAETNHAAIAAYRALGFAMAGRRPGYYRHPDGAREDALLFSRAIARLA